MYKITIEKTVEAVEIAGHNWAVIGTKEDDKPEYGYTPEIVKRAIKTVEIYSQTVEWLDVYAVIQAVNKSGIGQQAKGGE